MEDVVVVKMVVEEEVMAEEVEERDRGFGDW